MIDFLMPFGLAHVLLFVGLVYTAPSSLFLRLSLFALIVALCFMAVRSEFALNIPGQAGGQYIYGMMMSCSHFLLLARASALTHAKPGAEWRWGWDMLCSARWGVSPKIIPPFRRKDKSYVPSRREFLLGRAWDLVWTSSLIYLLGNYKLYIYSWDFSMVPDGFLHRLSEVSGREWIIRVYMTLVGKGEVYLTLRAGHSLVSLIGVGFGDTPERYPPLFGSIQETYRVRRFYVYFWHHLVRKVFTTHSSLVVNDILRVPRNTEVSRYLVLTGSFFMSAGMHIFIAPNIPLKCSIWPQLRYYLSIAGAIVLEDVLIITYNQTKKRLGAREATDKAGSVNATKTERPTDIQRSEKSSDDMVLREADQTVTNQVTGAKIDAQTDGNALRKRDVAPQEPKAEKSASVVPTAAVSTTATSKLFKVLGYVWVFAFEVWSTSKFLYLTQQCQIKLNTWPFYWEGDD